jgi:hypothetical protein
VLLEAVLTSNVPLPGTLISNPGPLPLTDDQLNSAETVTSVPTAIEPPLIVSEVVPSMVPLPLPDTVTVPLPSVRGSTVKSSDQLLGISEPETGVIIKS